MKAFEYASPTSVEQAIAVLAGAPGAAVLAGGTDLLSRMKDYVTSPPVIVYLNDLKPMGGIQPAGGGLEIGAGARLAELATDKTISEHYPAIRQAALSVGTRQIRNMASLGGSLLQRPRCWYYRAGLGLLAMRDGKSLVREGDNRHHAIFLTEGNALYVNPSSIAVPLIALGAKATLVGPKGERSVAIEDLYRVPKTSEESELTIAPDEILTKVTVPAAKGKNAAYEVRQKRAHDWPIVLTSVALEMDGDKVSAARIVLAGVAPIPWRSEDAEKAIIGKTLSLQTAEAAGAAAVAKAKPLSMNAYKVPIAKTTVKRALLAAVGNRYWEV